MLHVIVLLSFVSTALCYWGEIPESKEHVFLSVEEYRNHTVDMVIFSKRFGLQRVQMTLNTDVLTQRLRVYTVNHGKRREIKLDKHCHYRGTLRGNNSSSSPPSAAAATTVLLSKCSNFYRGSITTGSQTLYLSVDDDNRYVLFHEKDLPPKEERFAYEEVTESVNSSVTRFKRSSGIRTLEVVVVTDKQLWIQFSQNISKVQEYALATINNLDEIYRQYGIRIALVGFEAWRFSDLIPVTEQYAYTLRNFTMYRQEKLLNVYRGHDVSVLMTGVDFEGPIIGYAGIGTMCRSSSCNVNYNSRNDPKFFAAVIAHEIGHNFGMYHDTDECVCNSKSACIMSSSLGSGVTVFSECSKAVLKSFKGTCLDNIPTKLYTDPICGNGFVEEGEECDCGSYDDCVTNDPCCEPVGCKLKPESECFTGDCCTDCKFTHYKKVCRPASSECDLEEFCTGTDAMCPVNRFKQDGSTCSAGYGWCNYGSCMTREGQCVDTWGEAANLAPSRCYEKMNSKGVWFGNCGSLGTSKYIACVGSDVLCGKLFCEVPKGVKPLFPGLVRVSLPISNKDNVTCTSVYGSRSAENNDTGLVFDGTKCDTDKWCKSGQCVGFEKPPCPAPNGVECGGHGACNDLNQCHCDAGFDPEYNCAVLKKVARWDIKKIMLAVMVPVLIIIPLIVIGILILRRYNKRARQFFDRHSHIRFSVRLPSVSRRASYMRKNSKRQLPADKATAIPDKDEGGRHMSFNQQLRSVWDDPPPKATPPARPSSTYMKSNGYRPVQDGPQEKPRYTPVAKPSSGIRPSRPAPPPLPSRSGAGDPGDSPISPSSKRGPKALQSTTRDNIKMAISGPESARSLIDDRPLNDRMLAGSPLKDLRNNLRHTDY